MASRPIRDLSEYPRPWFYRPEIYYGLIIFPPVWSILTLRSPWHKGEGFFGIFIGGLAWFFLIASVVMSVAWVQNEAGGGLRNLFFFVPGVLLTLLTQVQWQAHRAHHGPPPMPEDEEPAEAAGRTTAPIETSDANGEGEREDSRNADAPESPADYTPRRRRRRRRRPISRSSDSAPLC